MRSTLLAALAAILFATAILQEAEARSIRIETLRGELSSGQPSISLVVNGVTVATLVKRQHNRPPVEAVSFSAKVVSDAFRRDRAEIKLREVDSTGNRLGLFLNGDLLFIAHLDEARVWDVEPSVLAGQWESNLRKAMSSVSKPAPEGDVVDIAASGNAALDKPGQQDYTPQNTGTLDFGTSKAAPNKGDAGIHISGGHSAIYEPPGNTTVSSAKLPGELVAQVTGRSASRSNAEKSVEMALRSYANAPPDAYLTWKSRDLADGLSQLKPGGSKRVEVSYSFSGSMSGSGSTTVLLENSAITAPKETYTFFSNDPEGVRKPQTLYAANLPGGKSGRLVLHHQNQGNDTLRMVARLRNTGGSATAVHVVEGASKPDINTFYIGFKSAEQFWQNLNSGAGYVASIPAGGELILLDQRLERGYTASAYMKLTNLGDAPLELETLTANPSGALPASADSFGSRSIYEAPYVVQTHNFVVGDPWLYLRLGEEEMLDSNDGSQLHGCYGVTHSYSVEINNPRDTPALAFLVLRASGGEVKGQFYINDEYISTMLVPGGEELVIKEIPLKPGQSKLLSIKAMPLNGGFYPASLILRQTRNP